MGALEDLQQKRKDILAAIKAKGGKENAPGLVKRLQDVETQIHDAKGGASDQPKLTRDEKKVVKDVQGGQNITNVLGFDEPLSRVDTEVPADQKAYMEAVKELADPSSPGFVGQRSDEEKGVVAGAKALMDGSGRTSEMSGVLDTLKGDVATAGKRSDDMKEILGLMEGGLAGLNAPENQALREQAQREVDRKYKAAVENLQDAARTTGIQSSARAGTRNARREAMGAQADMEQKNLLANVDVKRNARNDYADTLRNAETDESARYRDAITAYRDQLSDSERAEFDRRELATRDYGDRVTGLTKDERDRTRNALSDVGGSLKDRNDYFLKTTGTNLDQERTDRAVKVQSALGFAGETEMQRQRRRERKRMRKDKKKNGGGGGDSGSSGMSGPAQSYDGFDSQAKADYYKSVSDALGGVS